MKRLRGLGRILAAVVPLSLFEVGVDGGLTLGYKYLIDRAIVPHDGRLLALILAALAAGVAVAAALSFWRDRVYARWVARDVAALRQDLFDHAFALPAAYHDSHPAADTLARFSSDLAAFESWLAGAVNGLVIPALNLAMGVGLLFVLVDWRLAVAATLLWPVALLGPRLAMPRASRAAYEKKRREAALLERLEEPIGAYRVVQAYGLLGFVRRRFASALEPYAAALERSGFLGSLVERSTVMTIYVVQVAVVAAAAALAFHGRVTIGTFVAFVTVFWNLGWSVVVAARSAPSLVSAAASLRRVEELLAAPADPLARPGRPVEPLRDAVRLERVHFAYPGGPEILSDVSLEVPRGAFVVIVGRSGSGKSSILNLLGRFYPLSAGRILYDGMDVAEADVASLRGRMGFVLQNAFLFNASLRENIRLGRPSASDAEVEAAARQAEFHKEVPAIPGGYDAVLGPSGVRLSGGQSQRLALARALLRAPDLLLLDEATAALDPATETAVNETLLRGREGRTTVAVTHRLGLAVSADRVYVVEKGRVVEAGDHRELLARDGVYAGLWRRQQGVAVAQDGAPAHPHPDRLRETPLLASLDDAQRASLSKKFALAWASAGQTVVREGEPGDVFYLIARGRVSVSRGRDGGAVFLGRLGEGDEFGELALLDGTLRNATVVAETDCLFLTLARESFQALLRDFPDARRRIEAAAAGRRA